MIRITSKLQDRELRELSWSHGYLPKLPWSGGRARSGTLTTLQTERSGFAWTESDLQWLASETLKLAKNQKILKNSWRIRGEFVEKSWRVLVPSGGTLSKEAATFGSRQKTSRRSLILPKLQAYRRLLAHGTAESYGNRQFCSAATCSQPAMPRINKIEQWQLAWKYDIHWQHLTTGSFRMFSLSESSWSWKERSRSSPMAQLWGWDSALYSELFSTLTTPALG